ncbi:MAG TPA: class I SAM-dependent methyltransferase [Methylophilaceae bacterium]
MTEAFKDHFKTVAQQYADSRPTYPKELFTWLVAQCGERDVAWDCGTGSGQAARDLAAHFKLVIATDASESQISQVQPQEGIDYRVAPAELSGLASGSIDLVVVAQALHWFDVDAFHDEASRVLKPQGILAEWCYGHIEIDNAAVDGLIQHFYADVVGPHWPPERVHVENAYRKLPFPYERLTPPAFAMRVTWSLQQLMGYLRSWSATAQYIKVHGTDPVEELTQEVQQHWGDAETYYTISWPLSLRVGKK